MDVALLTHRALTLLTDRVAELQRAGPVEAVAGSARWLWDGDGPGVTVTMDIRRSGIIEPLQVRITGDDLGARAPEAGEPIQTTVAALEQRLTRAEVDVTLSVERASAAATASSSASGVAASALAAALATAAEVLVTAQTAAAAHAIAVVAQPRGIHDASGELVPAPREQRFAARTDSAGNWEVTPVGFSAITGVEAAVVLGDTPATDRAWTTIHEVAPGRVAGGTVRLQSWRALSVGPPDVLVLVTVRGT